MMQLLANTMMAITLQILYQVNRLYCYVRFISKMEKEIIHMAQQIQLHTWNYFKTTNFIF